MVSTHLSYIFEHRSFLYSL